MYTKEFNAERYRSIWPILEDLDRLEPGQSLLVEGKTIRDAKKIRLLFYDWAEKKAPRKYSVYLQGTDLIFLRRKELNFRIRGKELPERLRGLVQEMIVCSPLEAGRMLDEAGLDAEDRDLVEAEYERVMS